MSAILSASMVTALFGSSSSGTGSAASNPATAVAALRRATADGAETKGMARQGKDPATIRQIAQFRTAVASAKSLDAALKDPRVLAVLLPSLGLADQVKYPALAAKVLASDPSDENSTVSKLANSTWTEATKTLGLAGSGLAGLQKSSTLTTIEENFVRYQYRQSLDKESPGISDALYFSENAADNTNVYNVLGNAVLRRVVTGALGLPDQIAVQPIETQATAVTSRLNLATFSDSAAVKRLAERYVMHAAQNQSGTDSGTNLLAQFGWSA
ncbi:DUF1217 domain-containing protein [Roseomonas sp. NAR14]|uniref:DUF1217 domain-containing protein n=1 Tax=Roseomonas acroporae TaxID=2937791 RepID=A0A9X1Y6B5_9PROT|nr:DUF1217 domain-containing protein [Roseomonas acroporae]MCK8783050.1 DUF1217 domain-containing protein [Roseomonas acroporae]